MADGMDSATSIDLLIQKHKKEAKQLQAEIQKLKHSVPKGDKKRKKEITVQIAQLETDLLARHDTELKEARDGEKVASLADGVAKASLEAAAGDDDLTSDSKDNMAEQQQKKLSKTQKRREKKAQQDRDREDRIQQQEEENQTGERQVEANALDALLEPRYLAIVQIPSDGDCLYAAVRDQLQRHETELSVAQLRYRTAEHMRQNLDDFLPFLSKTDTGDPYTDEEFEKFCDRVEKTPEWGGQLEITALAHVLRKPIEVVQAASPQLIIGEEYDGPKLILSYHRHAYGLGEHYNSVVDKALVPTVDEDEGFT